MESEREKEKILIEDIEKEQVKGRRREVEALTGKRLKRGSKREEEEGDRKRRQTIKPRVGQEEMETDQEASERPNEQVEESKDGDRGQS
jgi:hypothetical protein